MAAHIMRAPIAVLLIAFFTPSQGQTEGAAASAATSDSERFASAPIVWYDVGAEIALDCALANPGALPVDWTVNGTAWRDSPLAARAQLERAGSRLVVPPRTNENDYGNYSCRVGSERSDWRVQGRPHARLPANVNAVEEQKIKIVCRLSGKPYPPVEWRYSNDSEAKWENATELSAALGGRVTFATSEAGVARGVAEVAAAREEDAGVWWCGAGEGEGASSTVLRVKDKYAALWPFLGICAEVLVLCAVILLYERRRTKPELDDSDTDNHDQKKS